jgi:hypothetical protein
LEAAITLIYIALAVHARSDRKTYFQIRPFPPAALEICYPSSGGFACRVTPLMSNVRAHQMQFARIGEYLAVSRITGPRHNLLQVRLATESQLAPVIECLPPQGGCTHEPMNEAEIVARVLEGVTEANAKLGCGYSVTHIRYVENDTKPEVVYAYMAFKLVEHLASGGEFVQRPSQNAQA